MDEQPADRTRLVVGLGNPGRRYERTRHNVGFRVADALAGRWRATPWKSAFGGLVSEAIVARGGRQQRVRLLKPETFMNASGQAARQAADYYRVVVEDVLVVLDDMALPLGRLRARPDGSAGGHKGLADVMRAFGTDAVPRLRIGIGQPPEPMAGEDYVLTAFGEDDQSVIAVAIESAARAVEDWLFEGLAAVMHKYNRPAETGED
ncbi:MAG: aminoacyl-tRNA hydrolase [Phycisphaerae bacterium]|nr:aminoacyl-tRNA hydrolase [Phycisphaerae bacterium]